VPMLVLVLVSVKGHRLNLVFQVLKFHREILCWGHFDFPVLFQSSDLVSVAVKREAPILSRDPSKKKKTKFKPLAVPPGTDAATDTDTSPSPLLPIRHPDIFDLNGVAQVLPALRLVIVEPVTAFAVIDPGGLEVAGRLAFE
jgi:hypothetical protein